MELNKHLRLELNQFLINCLVKTMDDEDINSNQDFAIMGLDSISVFDFTAQIKEAIPEIPLTIFLECKNIKELQNYLLNNHEEELHSFFKQ